MATQVFDVILPKIDAIQHDLTGRRIVEACKQFHDRGLALSVLPDQGDPLTRLQLHVEVVQDQPGSARIGEGYIAELEPPLNGARRRQRARLRMNRRAHPKKNEQVGQEEGLVGNAGESGKDHLDIVTRGCNGPREKRQSGDAQLAGHRLVDHESVASILAYRTQKREERACNQSPPCQRDILLINLIR